MSRVARGVHGQMPLSPRQDRGQPEVDPLGTGIDQQAQCARLIFMDQTGELSCVRVSSDLHSRPLFLRPGLAPILSGLLVVASLSDCLSLSSVAFRRAAPIQGAFTAARE